MLRFLLVFLSLLFSVHPQDLAQPPPIPPELNLPEMTLPQNYTVTPNLDPGTSMKENDATTATDDMAFLFKTDNVHKDESAAGHPFWTVLIWTIPDLTTLHEYCLNRSWKYPVPTPNPNQHQRRDPSNYTDSWVALSQANPDETTINATTDFIHTFIKPGTSMLLVQSKSAYIAWANLTLNETGRKAIRANNGIENLEPWPQWLAIQKAIFDANVTLIT